MTYNVNNDVYYLNCASCHWNSLSIGMTADNPYNIKREFDKTHQQEYTRVLELVQREAREIAALKDKNRPLGRRRLPTRQSLLSTPSASNVSATQTRVPITLQDIDKQQEEKETKMLHFPEVSDSDISDPIPDYYYDVKDLSQITTLQQRHANLHVHAPFLSNLVPVKKLLHTRRSKRCRKCDQLLIKPDLNFEIAKVEFKRLRIAYTVLPRVMVVKPLKVTDDKIPVEILIKNPMHTLIDLSFDFGSLPHHNAKVAEVPPATFVPGIPEEDEEEESADIKTRKEADSAQFVVQRMKNKLNLQFVLTPEASINDRVKFGLGMTLKYQDTTGGSQTNTFTLDFDFQLTK
eukprot:Phypoly_transcript_09282.p1 GENE.Phypoly_transcript_09282~~Phypoly_transcript_09282.p1  ORF type:complete len:402 (+),score=57.80 Phypoly_transcript_09282:164-1207(+)